MSSLSLALLLLLPLAARAAEPSEAAWKASCRRAAAVALPAADQPDVATQKQLAGCTSEALFYGVGQKADPDRARLCAYVERAAGDGVVFGGSAMLMTIYATGVGAPRSVPLAIRFACDLDGAPAEMEGRIAHLEALGRGDPKGPATFDLCDDVTSGFMQGHCAAHQQRIEQAKRDQRYAARLATWTPDQRAAFQRLRATADGFFRARAESEVDLSGTARAALQIQAETELETGFEALLALLERGQAPHASAEDFAGADRALNEAYRKIMKGQDPVSGTVTKAGVRRAEKSWVKYRDGWVALARIKFPVADSRGLKAWLTRQRSEMLTEFVPDAR